MVHRRVTRAEWHWVFIVSLGVLLLSAIPNIAGYASQTAEATFGGAVFDRADYQVHVACIQIGLQGEWLYSNLHTSESVRPAFVRTFYIFIGQVGRLLPLSPPVLFELARWCAGLWMLLTMYVFAARFLWAISLRRVAFLFCALSSGVGWLMLMLTWQPQPDVSPIDFWLLDLYGFFSLLTFPHIAMVMALSWTTVMAMLTHWETNQNRWLIIGLVMVLVAQMIQPFAPFVVDVVLSIYAVGLFVARRHAFPLRSLFLFAVVQIPLGIYSTTFFFFDLVWQSFTQQNLTLSPSPEYYLLGLGAIGVLAIWGGVRVSRRRFDEANVLLVWIVVVAILVYLPFQFQRRFTEGIIGPLAILATMGLGYGLLPMLSRWKDYRRGLANWRYPHHRARAVIVMLIIAMTMPSTLYLVFGGALLSVLRSPQLFDSIDVVDAIDWLGANAGRGDTVFSAERTGALIPARIGHRVFLGHPMETADYDRKTETVARFFSPEMQDDERIRILRDCRCRLVFYGPAEQALGMLKPDAENLRLEYSNRTVNIYRVLEIETR